jgi:hypothetical protein
VLGPERLVTRVEARLRRHHFQRAAIREIGLANARPLLGRIEEIEPEPHAAAVAQAMARPAVAVERMLPWVEPGGWILVPGGERAPVVPERPGLEPVRCVRYQVPAGGPSRTLWLGRVVARERILE